MPHHIPFECMVGCNSVFLLYNDLAEFFTVCVTTMFDLFIYLFISTQAFRKTECPCLRVFFGFGNVP